MGQSFESFKESGVPEPLLRGDEILDRAAIEKITTGNVIIDKTSTQSDKRSLSELATEEYYDNKKKVELRQQFLSQQKDFFYDNRRIKPVALLCRDLRVVMTEMGVPANKIHELFTGELATQIKQLGELEKDPRPRAEAAATEVLIRHRIFSTTVARTLAELNKKITAIEKPNAEVVEPLTPTTNISPTTLTATHETEFTPNRQLENLEDQTRLGKDSQEERETFLAANKIRRAARRAEKRKSRNTTDESSKVDSVSVPEPVDATLEERALSLLEEVSQRVPEYRALLQYGQPDASPLDQGRRETLHAVFTVLLRGGKLRKHLDERQADPTNTTTEKAINDDIIFIMKQFGKIEAAVNQMRVSTPKAADKTTAVENVVTPVAAIDVNEKLKRRLRLGFLAAKASQGNLTESEKNKLAALEADDSLWDLSALNVDLDDVPVSLESIQEDMDQKPSSSGPVMSSKDNSKIENDAEPNWIKAYTEWEESRPVLAENYQPQLTSLQSEIEILLRTIDSARTIKNETVLTLDKVVDLKGQLEQTNREIERLMTSATGVRSELIQALRTKVAEITDDLKREGVWVMREPTAPTPDWQAITPAETPVSTGEPVSSPKVGYGTPDAPNEVPATPEGEIPKILGLELPKAGGAPYGARDFRDALNIEWQPIKRAAEAGDADAAELRPLFEAVFKIVGYVPESGLTEAEVTTIRTLAEKIAQPERVVGEFTLSNTAAPVEAVVTPIEAPVVTVEPQQLSGDINEQTIRDSDNAWLAMSKMPGSLSPEAGYKTETVSDFKVSDTVIFNRSNGGQSIGSVLSLNPSINRVEVFWTEKNVFYKKIVPLDTIRKFNPPFDFNDTIEVQRTSGEWTKASISEMTLDGWYVVTWNEDGKRLFKRVREEHLRKLGSAVLTPSAVERSDKHSAKQESDVVTPDSVEDAKSAAEASHEGSESSTIVSFAEKRAEGIRAALRRLPAWAALTPERGVLGRLRDRGSNTMNALLLVLAGMAIFHPDKGGEQNRLTFGTMTTTTAPEFPLGTSEEEVVVQTVESLPDYKVEKCDNYWDFVEGDVEDRDPLPPLDGLSERAQAKLIAYAVQELERDPELAKSFGISSGDPNLIFYGAKGDTLKTQLIVDHLERVKAKHHIS